MNFLSHLFLKRNVSSPYYKLGVLMPDLVYQFNSKLRRDIFNHDFSENDDHREIFEGINRHYQADAIFHQSEFFEKYSKLIHSRIKESALPSVSFRSYFLAHVFLELLLDRVLVKQYPLLAVKIYSELESVNPEVAASYFLRIGKPGVYSEFFYNFNRLLNAGHLHFLANNEMFVKALLRVYSKINPVEASFEERASLMALTDEIENGHRQELSGVFEAMSHRLAAHA